MTTIYDKINRKVSEIPQNIINYSSPTQGFMAPAAPVATNMTMAVNQPRSSVNPMGVPQPAKPNMTMAPSNVFAPKPNMTYAVPQQNMTMAPSNVFAPKPNMSTPNGGSTFVAPPKLNTSASNPSPTSGSNVDQPARPIPRVTVAESLSLKKDANLTGTNINIMGKTYDEAQKILEEARNNIQKQQSENTSFTFNPQTISGVKNVMTDFQMRLDSINNNPMDKFNKQTNKGSLLLSTATDIAKNFPTMEEFNKMQQNPEAMRSVDAYLKAGGSMADIAAKITPVVNGILPETDSATFLANQNNFNNQATITSQTQNMDGTITQRMSDGNTITTDISGNPVPNQELYNKLDPETTIGQKEIARLAGIPKSLHDMYFGTPEKMGILQQEINLEGEKRKLLEKKEKDAQVSANATAQYNIDKNNNDVAEAKATTKLNHLKSKNYMTGMLAKMGALITTGNAPLALATLDEQYNTAITTLDTKLSFANREIEINLKDKINDLQNNLADKLISITEDLNKTEKTIMKEVFEAQSKSEREIYSINSGAAKNLRTAKDTYQNKADAQDAKYASGYLSLAGKGLNNGQILSILSSSGIIDTTKITPNIMKLLGKKEGGSGGDFSPSESRTLSRAGLGGSASEIKNFFLSAESEFQDTWTRNIDVNRNPTIKNIQKSYSDWASQKENRLTSSQAMKLEQSGYDSKAYQSDPEYKAEVDRLIAESK